MRRASGAAWLLYGRDPADTHHKPAPSPYTPTNQPPPPHQVVVIDEIGTEAECSAARTIAQRGVQLIATAHGNELENVVKNPALSDLIGGIQSVTLGALLFREGGRRGCPWAGGTWLSDLTGGVQSAVLGAGCAEMPVPHFHPSPGCAPGGPETRPS